MWFRWSSSVGTPLRSPGGGTKRWAKCAATGIGMALLPFMVLALVTDVPAQASGATLYAYTSGTGTVCTAPSTVASSECTLTEALNLAAATTGDTIDLEVPGTTATYDGNWALTATAVTIQPASDISNPILNGSGFTGAVFSLANVNLTLDNLTIENGHNTSAGPSGPSLGGAIDTYGGTVTISGCTFTNQADYGGAINNANGDWSSVTFATVTGTVVVAGSTFTNNSAVLGSGGAIDNAGAGGHGTLNVTDSTFTSNSANGTSAIQGDGGAIDNGDESGSTGALMRDDVDLQPKRSRQGRWRHRQWGRWRQWDGRRKPRRHTLVLCLQQCRQWRCYRQRRQRRHAAASRLGVRLRHEHCHFEGGAIATDRQRRDQQHRHRRQVQRSSRTPPRQRAMAAPSNDSDYDVGDGTTSGLVTANHALPSSANSDSTGEAITTADYGGQGK